MSPNDVSSLCLGVFDMAQKIKVRVDHMNTPRHEGDWHDKPLKRRAFGPGDELQLFSTKKEATLYARCRRASADAQQAQRNYLNLR